MALIFFRLFVKQAITLLDNGIRIGEQGLNALKLSVLDIDDDIEMKLFGASPEKFNFKFRMENQNRLFLIDSFLTKQGQSDEVFKFKVSMISAEDTAVLNRLSFQQLSEESSLSPMVVELFKVVKTCLDPFMVGAAQGIYLFAQGEGGTRKKYGGDFTFDSQLLGGDRIGKILHLFLNEDELKDISRSNKIFRISYSKYIRHKTIP